MIKADSDAQPAGAPTVEKLYLLGVVTGPSDPNKRWAGFVLTYRPAGSELSPKALIGIYEPMVRGEGGETDAITHLGSNDESWRRGWFEQLCREANCPWLMPVLQRLARGEEVSTDEIARRYQAHTGQPIFEGTMNEIFEFAKRHYRPVRGPAASPADGSTTANP